jgi:hypothetical protein
VQLPLGGRRDRQDVLGAAHVHRNQFVVHRLADVWQQVIADYRLRVTALPLLRAGRPDALHGARQVGVKEVQAGMRGRDEARGLRVRHVQRGHELIGHVRLLLVDRAPGERRPPCEAG